MHPGLQRCSPAAETQDSVRGRGAGARGTEATDHLPKYRCYKLSSRYGLAALSLHLARGLPPALCSGCRTAPTTGVCCSRFWRVEAHGQDAGRAAAPSLCSHRPVLRELPSWCLL